MPRREKIYLILDSLSPHFQKDLRKWCKANKIVFTPTNASWLNRIECHLSPIAEFVIRNFNYLTHAELAIAMKAFHAFGGIGTQCDSTIVAVGKRVKVS